jgi:hypothetical protein
MEDPLLTPLILQSTGEGSPSAGLIVPAAGAPVCARPYLSSNSRSRQAPKNRHIRRAADWFISIFSWHKR